MRHPSSPVRILPMTCHRILHYFGLTRQVAVKSALSANSLLGCRFVLHACVRRRFVGPGPSRDATAANLVLVFSQVQ